MSIGWLMLLTIALPALAAPVIWHLSAWPRLRDGLTVGVALALFGLVLNLLPPVAAGQRPTQPLVQMLPGLELGLAAEPLGLVFALIASGLWLATAVYAIGYLRAYGDAQQSRFHACFALALACTMGIALAGDLLTLLVFYEALTLATYPLVTHSGTAEARRAGRVYLGLLLGTSLGLLVLAVALTYVLAGRLDFQPGGILAERVSGWLLPVLLALYVFGIGKAALMPFHRWLPAAMVAPAPVSALLHAVAVVKAGVFAILKIVIYVFGFELVAGSAAGTALAYVAAVTILLASLVALAKDNLKARLAYSTVSQLAYVVLGAMLANAAGIAGGALQIAMHAFGKITLFFCAGAILVASHESEISRMRGLGRRMPVTFAAFFIGSLGIIGLPPAGGVWSKWQLIEAACAAGQGPLVLVLLLSSVLSAAYLLPVAVRAFQPVAGTSGAGAWQVQEAPMLCLVPLCLTAFGTLALFVLADPLYRFLLPLLAVTP